MKLHFEPKAMTERFVRYAAIYTQSREGVPDTPSTPCQRDLAKVLTKELQEMGAKDVAFDEDKCYVYAEIPGNLPKQKCDPAAVKSLPDAAKKRRENTAPILGLMAHMDTSCAVDAREIHPRVIENYDGSVIRLNEKYVLDPAEYPDLAARKGQTLIVTDGTSVLGGDDKAGVTAIMEAAAFFLSHKEIAHPTIRIAFTPDEEVGNGTLNLDYDRFACDYAYTVDGGGEGELEYENFNAASCDVHVTGLSTHPGSAYGKMKNALLVANEFINLLPALETPYYTKDHEGFFHVEELHGTCDSADLAIIIRDHDAKRFAERKETAEKIGKVLNDRYGAGTVDVKVRDSYYNMLSKIEPHMHLVENAKKAMEEIGVAPKIQPIRGGTDGCVISFRGIPCPNLFTGAHNYHSRYEYVSGQELALSAETLIRIMNKYAEYDIDR